MLFSLVLSGALWQLGVEKVFSLLVPLPMLCALASDFTFVAFASVGVIPFSKICLGTLRVELFDVFMGRLLSLLRVVLKLASI